ncbi:hypothetical protein Chor_013631 [Crotalus horridus]
MQISIACTEQNLRSRSSDDRLCGGGPGGRAAGAAPAGGGPGQGSNGAFQPPGKGLRLAGGGRPAGQTLPHQLAFLLRESTGRATGMNYRSHGTTDPMGYLPSWLVMLNVVGSKVAESVLTVAYENGVNLFDTAEVYASGKAEKTLGNILKRKAWRRSSYVVTTKIYWGGQAETERGLSRKHIIEGLKGSLQRLQLGYVDIVFANRMDANSPMEEGDLNFRVFLLEDSPSLRREEETKEKGTLVLISFIFPFFPPEIVRAMTYVINQGMAMYWGTSRWSAMEIMEAYSVARQFNLIPPVCEQAEYHMFQREKVETQLPELYHKIGVGAITWSPLACGLITGKYEERVPENCRASMKEKLQSEDGKKQQSKVKALQPIAERLGCTVAQLAIAWCLRSEGVSSVLLGVSSAEQLIENLGSIQVNRLNTHKPPAIPGFPPPQPLRENR